MLVVKKFADKDYVSPEDKVKMYHEIPGLINFWIQVVLQYSNSTYDQLPENLKKSVTNFLYFSRFLIDKNKTIGPQIDKRVIENILWAAVECNRYSTVDQIYEKTKHSIFNYFHYELIIDAYLKLDKQATAIQVIDFLFKKGSTGCMYAIRRYPESEDKNHVEFNQALKDYKDKAVFELLSRGEKVTLFEVTLGDLIKLVQNVRPKIK